jgi:2-keto-4-pentenoate hydratase/2-oxohepta-3-ene-1,7-dioic acid hydratase in catechol pathway
MMLPPRSTRRAIALLAGLALMGIGLTAAQAEGPMTKYCRFEQDGQVSYGIVQAGGTVRKIDGDLFGRWRKTDTVYPLADVKLLVPCKPSKVLAVAVNYPTYGKGDQDPPDIPQLFLKTPSCLTAHRSPIIFPKELKRVDPAAEMAIVIGRRAKDVPVGKALDYVLGATCGNDIAGMDWFETDSESWRGKGADTFGPLGPWIVSGVDYGDLDIALRLNGEKRQESNTSHMVFGVAEIVSFVSQNLTLEPGDVIFTGTPGGEVTLTPGDTVSVELENVGTLVNPVVVNAGVKVQR